MSRRKRNTTTTTFRAWMCGQCGYMMDSASPAFSDDAVPDEDDISVCLNCGAVYVLHAGIWRPITTQERTNLSREAVLKITRVQIARALTVTDDLSKPGGNA